ncbi:MAG TPA: hypothetical protein DDW94_03770 [Deltaproteobacteria bacterium]|nr:MAG: hypothetical protein A2Z79_11010 [Deltaproteobacteria bacterium GWA2_55_82]OGQ64429.1 MAG: hypothetical protein A3I81_03055 [Deltaproteobacteria bacterium RIFCSPLOWO2_02_FULL_55_12]OIJ72810.1 MAG: hypothetical protein A2V21_300195 [Deltaproteobacteria bacterium GWC2_55_46]HBG46088.1 hypothetical protein [Deltaproteobacteria bacterium]HCY11586.1 hypothetical protein [Deltaproteobacteria bacterium]
MHPDFLKIYERLIAPSPDHCFIVNRDYEYLVVNDAYLKAHAMERDEVVGRTMPQVLGEGVFRILIKDYIDRSFAGEVINYRAWFEFKGVGRRFMNIACYPFIAQDGTVSGAVVVSRDITGYKVAEERLAESEEKYRHLFENLNDAAMLADTATGIIVETNREGEVLLGRSRDEIIGMHQSQLHPPGKAEEYRQKFATHIEHGRAADYDGEMIRKDGTVVQVHISAAPLNVGGKGLILGLFKDITERQLIQNEHLKSQKLESLGRLAGGIAHNFNNILTCIMSNISLALFYGPDERIAKRLQEAERACDQAKDLVRQFLTFSKGGAPVKEPMLLDSVMGQWCSFATSGSRSRCEFKFSPDLLPVEADPGMLSQAIQNIVLNADQAMAEGGIIKISVFNADQAQGRLLSAPHVCIRVEDQGVGIPESEIGKVFDPYFSTKAEGGGLGLTTAYSIIKDHGGFIDVSSIEGKGSVFSVYLPASDLGVQAPCGHAQPRNVRVLVMDDEDMIREAAGEVLKVVGCDVEFASDGAEAIGLFRDAMVSERPFDLVIMDLTIPAGMGGKEAVSHILEIDPHARVVVSSGYSNDPVMSEYARYGFSGVLPKPYRANEMIALVTRLLANR